MVCWTAGAGPEGLPWYAGNQGWIQKVHHGMLEGRGGASGLATATSPSSQLTDVHQVQMLSLKQQYMTYIDDMSDSELENYDMNSCQTSIVEEVVGMFGHTVSDQQVISECSRLNNELTARRTARLTASNKSYFISGFGAGNR